MDWRELMNMVSRQWRHLLKSDDDTTKLFCGWFHTNGEEDPAFVCRCTAAFTVSCVQWYNISLPLPVLCYTVGTHSRCLREWDRLLENWTVFSMKLRLSSPIEDSMGRRKMRKKKKILFFYGKVTTFGRDPDRWRWTNGGRFLDYTTKEGRESIVDRNPRVTRASEIW